MSSTGGKTQDKRLDPLAMSEGLEVLRNFKSSAPEKTAYPAQHTDSYAQRLQREGSKFLGLPPASRVFPVETTENASKLPVLKLDVDQIYNLAPANTPPAKYIENLPNISEKSRKFLAPRARPFSEKSYVRVKVISQDLDSDGKANSEKICWMQRDAIWHYLTIQDIEKQRAATKGAVNGSPRHDA